MEVRLKILKHRQRASPELRMISVRGNRQKKPFRLGYPLITLMLKSLLSWCPIRSMWPDRCNELGLEEIPTIRQRILAGDLLRSSPSLKEIQRSSAGTRVSGNWLTVGGPYAQGSLGSCRLHSVSVCRATWRTASPARSLSPAIRLYAKVVCGGLCQGFRRILTAADDWCFSLDVALLKGHSTIPCYHKA